VDFISNSVAFRRVHKMLVIIKLLEPLQKVDQQLQVQLLCISAGVHSAGSIVNHLNNDF
jgi:hypothetical protein